MREIVVERRIFGRRLRARRAVPSSWSEMSEEGMRAFGEVLAGKADDVSFFKGMFSLPWWASLSSWQMYCIMDCMGFLTDMSVGIDRFLIGSLCGGRLSAPERRLNGVTLMQWMMVDTYFSKYARHESDEMLDLFVAHLYTVKGVSFEKAVDVDAVRCESRGVKLAVAVNFGLVKNWLSKGFPFLFPEGDGDGKGGTVKGTQWLDVFDAFVGDDVAMIDRYERLPVLTAFRILNRRILDSKKRR